MNPDPDVTPMPNSTKTKASLLAGTAIRPTAMERRHGRLMRAPDHDAGTGGEGGGAPAGDPAPEGGASDPAAADPAGTGSEAPAGEGEAETSLLGGAVSKEPKDGDGKAGEEDGGKPGESKEGDPKPAAEHVVPEAYELSVEGVELDPKAIEEATPFFKEAGLSNDQANKIMPAAAKFRDSVAEQTLQQLVDQGAQQKADWAEAMKSDAEIGGAKLDETLHLAAKGLDALGYPEGSDFRKVLTETGFGNHPEMARIMRRVGEMVSEDGFPRPGATPATPLSVEKRMYPND